MERGLSTGNHACSPGLCEEEVRCFMGYRVNVLSELEGVFFYYFIFR